jgi:hypothetical protein
MKLKKANANPLPVGAIFPEGGEPLYEEAGTGIRLTAQDFAAKHGYENASEVIKAYEKSKEVEINGRRTTEPNNDAPGTGI